MDIELYKSKLQLSIQSWKISRDLRIAGRDLAKLSQKKNKEFIQQRAVNQHVEITARLSNASLMTILSMQTSLALSKAIEEFMRFLTEKERQEFSEVQFFSRSLEWGKPIFQIDFGKLDKVSHEHFQEFISVNQDLTRHWQSHTESVSNLAKSRRIQLLTIQLLASRTLLDIFRTSPSYETLAILSIFAKIILPLLFPYGGELIFLDDFRRAIDSRSQRIKTSSDTLTDLDDYVFSTYRWSVLTQLTINKYQTIYKNQPQQYSLDELTLNAAIAEVEDRLNHLRSYVIG